MTIGIILTTLALFELCLALWFLSKYQRSTTIVSYALFALGSAIYVGMNGVGYISGSYYFGEKLGWLGGVIATTFFLTFSMSYPHPRKAWREMLPWILWPLVIFGLGIIATNLFIGTNTITHFGDGYMTSVGTYFSLLIVYVAFYWTWSITNLVRSYRHTADAQHRMIRYILIGTLVSLTGTITFDIIIPLITVSNLGYVGSLFNAAWLGMTSNILVRKV